MLATETAQLNDIDFDALKIQMSSAPAFPHFCIDDFLDESFALAVHDAFPSFEAAARVGDSFDAVNEKGKIQVTDASRFPPAILQLHRILASDDFVSKLSYVSGIDHLIADPALSGGGIHETISGGHLDVHIDFNFNEQLGLHRRLNLLVYFNQDWREEYGGYLDLWGQDVAHCVGRFAPRFNRAAAFATSGISWHGVTPIKCPPGGTRKSFAVYYYTKEPPPLWDGAKHSTIFRARPDEYWKGNFAMPAEKLLRATRHKVEGAKRRIGALLGS